MKYFIGRKKKEYYGDLLIKADLGLHEQITRKIKNELPDGGVILDMGAGEGALSARLSDLGYNIVAADTDEKNFKCKSISFSCVDFNNKAEVSAFIEKNEGAFDAVLGIEVIEHVHNPWQYIKQLMKMVKKGGFILITTPNISSWLSRIIFLFTGKFHQFSESDLSYGHINPISASELELILNNYGACNIEITPAGTLPPVYFNGINKLILINLLALFFRPAMRGVIDGWCIMATARKI